MKSIFAIRFSLIMTAIALSLATLAQKHHISGYVSDASTGERLIGASVVIDSTSTGVATDNLGYFSLQIEIPATIRISFTGYANMRINIENVTTAPLNISLLNNSTNLDTVEIVSSKNIINQKLNVNTLTAKEIERLPVIGSKPDIMKAAQLLPGIEPMNEATSSLIVRGGNPGENSYLFDNVPLIYVNHLGGFMSVFNSEMINSLKIYKGGFPAKYGGKLSSIVDITQREGDKNNFKGSLCAGATDISFSFEGPAGLKNSSFIITGRKTFIDLYYLGVSAIAQYVEAQDFSILYGFHDINGKYSWHPNNKNSFYLNIYEGDDYLKIWKKEEDRHELSKFSTSNVWGNFLVSGVWNRIVNPKLFVSNTISYSKYRLKNKYNLYAEMSPDTIDYWTKGQSAVQDIGIQSNWKYPLMNNWNMEFGAQVSLQISNPNNYTNQYIGSTNISEILYGLNSVVYLENKIHLLKIINANLGVRLSHYYTKDYNKLSIEPRADINILLSDNHLLNLSYMRVTQNSYLLFTAGNIMNNEVWVPAGADIKSSYSDQLSFGWRGSLYNNMFEAEVDIYYKKLYNLATYKEGCTNIIGDGNWRNKVISGGSGKSMGLEIMLKKTTGNWTGFASYTLSHATRQFEEINNGEEYIFDFNRPHSFSVNIAYDLNRKWSFSALWICQSGLPYTPVLAVQYIPILYNDGSIHYEKSFIFGERNSEKLKLYHRLDLVAKYSKYSKRGR